MTPAWVIAGDSIVSIDGLTAGLAAAGSLALRETEIEHLDGAVIADLDVGRLEIAMHDAGLVRRFERLGNLPRDGEGFVKGNRALRDAIRERRPLHQLHHERRNAAGLLEAVDRGDVGMVERGQRLRFAVEARQAVSDPRPPKRAAP